MDDVPSIAVTLFAEHKLDPFFFDYSLAWVTNVTKTSFTACIHEAVLFSGKMCIVSKQVAVQPRYSHVAGSSFK